MGKVFRGKVFMGNVEVLLEEYNVARAFSERLVNGLSGEQIAWRPHVDSSAIGWHLGHQAAVNHFMVRNLTSAEPSKNSGFDALFDSATPETDRGQLPAIDEILAYRSAIAASTTSIIDRIATGNVGAPAQLGHIAEGMLRSLINHEYQHDTWVLEVRRDLGLSLAPEIPSSNVRDVDGYWMVTI